MKLKQTLYIVRKHEIYPVRYEIGDECPVEFEEIAKEKGLFEVKKEAEDKTKK